jgi:hypothetical protein
MQPKQKITLFLRGFNQLLQGNGTIYCELKFITTNEDRLPSKFIFSFGEQKLRGGGCASVTHAGFTLLYFTCLLKRV